MKFYVVLSCMIASISAQRPSFAGLSPKGVPELASRFRPDSTDSSSPSTTTAPVSGIANRVGEDNTGSNVTPSLPVDARGDADLVNRIRSWPRENQPFWYVNAQHIEKHRNPQGSQGGNNLPQGQQQSQTVSNRNAFENKQEVPNWSVDQQVSRDSTNKDQLTVVSRNSFDPELEVNGKKPKYVEKVVYRYYF